MSQLKFDRPTTQLESYFDELLNPLASNRVVTNLPSISKYAVVLEGERINAALFLEDFGGVLEPGRKMATPIVAIDSLLEEHPTGTTSMGSLVVKVLGFPLGIACKRVNTIFDIQEAKPVFHYDEKRPWSAAMVKSHWAILLDVSKIPKID